MNITSGRGLRHESNYGWEAILVPGERAIWNGRSDGAVVLTANALLTALGGFGIVIFILFVLILAATSPSAEPMPFIFKVTIMIFLAHGVFLIFDPVFSAYRRKRCVYVLTNKRAIIMSDIPLLGKRTTSYPLVKETTLEYDWKNPGSIYFKSKYQYRLDTNSIGFERIPDAVQVFRLAHSVQRGKA